MVVGWGGGWGTAKGMRYLATQVQRFGGLETVRRGSEAGNSERGGGGFAFLAILRDFRAPLPPASKTHHLHGANLREVEAHRTSYFSMRLNSD